MKKTPLLNVELSEVIAGMGHGDMLVIGDAGLPIPLEVRRIDLALTRNVPGFVETLRAVLSEMQVQSAMVAEETRQNSPHILEAIKQLLPDTPIEDVTHTMLKTYTEDAVAVVRTGEFTPYANIILVAGVVF